MGHKVHPRIHRTQIIYTWDSKWFSKRNYAACAEQDILARDYLGKKFKDAHIDSISVERSPKNMTITIFAAKPGFIIGRGGKGLDDVRKYVERHILKMSTKTKINVQEVRSPALSARIVAQSMVGEIERRIPFRRVMKQAIERTMKAGARGIKVQMSGRLNGVEIAREETLSMGKIPLITLRSDVDYGAVEANTIYGKIGVKAWVYQGEIFGRKDIFDKEKIEEEKEPERKRRTRVRTKASKE